MTLRKIVLLTFLVAILLPGWSQSAADTEPQSPGVGQTIPDLTLTGIRNTRHEKVALHELLQKGNLIIFFWNLHCMPCIDAFTNIVKISGAAKTKLNWLFVSEENDSIVNRFFRQQELLTGIKINFPYTCKNEMLQKVFLPKRSPYCVWIDKQRTIRFITRSKQLTNPYLSAFANNESFTIPVQDKTEISFKLLKPLFINGNAGSGENLVQYIALSPYIKGIPYFSGIPKDSMRSFAMMYNYSIKQMFQSAYNDLPDNGLIIPNNRTILDVEDTTRYVDVINNEQQPSNLWCYQRIAPKTTDDSMHKLIQRDINSFFGLTGHVEKQKRLCWVLTADDTTLLKSKGGEPFDFHDVGHFSFIFRNHPIGRLTIRLILDMLSQSPYPFIDETNFKGRIDLTLDNVVTDRIDLIQKSLEAHKMHLCLEERLIDILVIRKANQ